MAKNPQKMDLLKREVIFVTGLSVIAITLAYSLLYKPKSIQIKKIQKQIYGVHKDIDKMKHMVDRVPNPKKEIEVIKERLQKLKEKAIDREQIPRIIQQLFQKTGELNIEVRSIKPRDNVEGLSADLPEGVSKVFIEANIRCSYRTLINYVRSLEDLQLLFTIEDLSIGKSRVEAVETLDVTLLFSTYVMA